MDGGQIATRLAHWFMGLALAAIVLASPLSAPAAGAQSTPASAAATPRPPGSDPMTNPTMVTGTIVFPKNLSAGPPIPPVVWELVGYTATNASPVEVAEPARYTLQFLPEGRLVARLDCNQGSGGYTPADGVLTLTPMAATLKLCLPNSQVNDFGRLLHATTSYRFDPDGHLLLRGEDGVLRLQPALTGVLWQWQRNVANDGSVTLTPDHPEHYTVTFLPEDRLAIQADCNRAMGDWTVAGAGIDLRIGGVTRRACPPGSLMHPFLDALDSAVSHAIQGGNLALALPQGGGVMVFAPVFVAPERATPAAG
jgi:heat shock protein HslJ